jgi:ABC-type uncharacterized transport system substrate-binding protein
MRKLALWMAPALLALACSGCAHKKVLMLTEYAPGSARAAEVQKAVDRELSVDNVAYALKVVNLDLMARPSAVWREERGTSAVVQINTVQPDIVMIAGDEALKAIADRVEGRFIKVVFFDVRSSQPAMKLLTSGYGAGIVADAGVVDALTLMKGLKPDLRGVAILSDKSATAEAVVGAFTAAKNLPLPVVDVRRAGTQAEWMKAVESLQSQQSVALCIANCSAVLSDANDGTSVPAQDILRMTSAANRLPDFSFNGEHVGAEGVMLAVYVPVKDQAAQAGALVNRVLFRFGDLQAAGVQKARNLTVTVNRDRATVLGIKLPLNIENPRAEPAPAAK